MIERGEVDVVRMTSESLCCAPGAPGQGTEAVTQILNLDDKTPNFSIDQQLDDEGRLAPPCGA